MTTVFDHPVFRSIAADELAAWQQAYPAAEGSSDYWRLIDAGVDCHIAREALGMPAIEAPRSVAHSYAAWSPTALR